MATRDLPPTKKNKISLTWASLLKDVDESVVPTGYNLESVLSDELNPEAYATSLPDMRKFILKGVLDEICGGTQLVSLIESIILSTDNVLTGHFTEVPLTTRIEKCELAPSKVKQDEITLVARIILRSERFGRLNEFVQSLPLIEDPPSVVALSQDHDTLSQDMKKILDLHAIKTGDIFSSEASSYPFLACMCLHFVQQLEHVFSGESYKYYPQYTVAQNRKPGSNPQTDSCVVHVVSSEAIPRMLYECKTSLAHTPLQLNNKDIIEVLLQGYYCLQKHKLKKMLICLTDLIEWHYMQIESTENKKMVVKGYRHFKGLQTEQGTTVSFPLLNLQAHTKFLIDMERLLHHN